jgi:hypothetical protein
MTDEKYVPTDVLCREYLADLDVTPDALDWQQRQGLRAELIRERALIPGAGKRRALYLPSRTRAVVIDWLHRRMGGLAA